MLLAGSIFLLTLVLVIWQPRGLSIGWSASIGAVLALGTGVIHIADIPVVWNIVWNATAAFIAVIIISLLLDESGFFEWAALHVSRWGNGRGRLLFTWIVLLGAAVAALFANDGAALILTPIVIAMLLALGFSQGTTLAFVMAAGFIADTASLPLIVSNLVNIVSADFFGLGFTQYASVMIPVDAAAIAATLIMLHLFFRRDIPAPEAVLNGLTDGQKKATTLVLGTTDQFIGIQGYAGVGKTTQLKAVISALETIPADVRPVMTGLAPTHQAVKEMSDVGVRAQTIKSFIVEHDQATAAGGKPDYKGQVFLIDESSMAGNQDTAALFKAIASGGGRAVSMGDIDQFESVDVGAPFKLMQERSPMDVAIMKQIVRQKDLQLRGAVHDIIDNRIDAALQRIETQPADRVARSASASLPGSAIQETETPVNDIVADWTDRTPEARSRTLIITQLNADRRAVNAGIHAVLAARGELGEKAITVPVLDKITHTRHEFNKTDAWEAGMVVKRGDRYQDVLAVDRNGSTVTVRDEEGKIGLYSLKELITGDVQLFRRSEREVRAGDLLKFTATDKEQGQMASQRYTVESVSETGNIRLKGENGRITINPQAVRAQQHIDYGWAVTGYGAQGASSDYVIALEGTEGGRKALASRCAFYISASRVKEHVQIYTDGKADWVKAVKTPERDIKTAHDALAPETQRKQAKAIWAMGQPVNKTAMGRAWVRHQGMQDASLTAKIIPATRRFPEPALALPVYDNNGRSAGLALVSLVASPEGRMTQGETRMVMTERARGAVLQRSQSGNTIVASDLAAALDAVRHHPKDGVVWQTGDEPPSAHLLKVSGGIVTEAASEHKLIRDQEETTRQTEKDMLNKAVKAEKEKSETQERIVVPVEDAVRITPGMLEVDDRNEPTIPAGKVLIQVASSDSVSHDEIGRHIRAEKEPLASKVASERAGVSRIVNELANTERDIIRQPENSERGRMPEREEQTLTRTIQKER
ncbi:hypothetical protein C3390_19195 [Enterobacter cloacae complex sp. ECNIH15]|nr:hypothetical protein C3390_19195 [Enterobacter cloacae complex sp. ECNIH15]